jgi:hypothetical protein
MSKSGKPR